MGVLIPGTTTWPEAIPVFVVAVALLFVPGTVAGLLARLRPLAAITVAPVLTTTFLTFDGVVCGALGIRWTVPVLLGALAVTVGLAGGVARLVSRREPSATRGPVYATAGGLVVAFAVFVVAMLREVHTPEEFPQHPDTIYHLGAALRMLERGDISVLHTGGFITPSGTGFYPAAFHDFTASIALLTGSSVVTFVIESNASSMREHNYCVYIVASRTHVLYIGVTNNLRRRVWEHTNGTFAGFTAKYRCHRLVWFESYSSVDLAITREKQLKNWSRIKKIVLIERENPAWADLSEGWYETAGPSTL